MNEHLLFCFVHAVIECVIAWFGYWYGSTLIQQLFNWLVYKNLWFGYCVGTCQASLISVV